jgi:hypothetical protein
MLDFCVFDGSTTSGKTMFSGSCTILCHLVELLQDGFIRDLKVVSK